MRDHQRLQLAQKLAVAPQLEVELNTFDDGSQPLLLQPPAFSSQQCVRGHAAERLAAPDTERLLDLSPSDPRLTGRARLACPIERLLPAVDVALPGSHVQPVSARVTDQPPAVGARLAEPVAQPRDVHLQAVTRPRGRRLTPQFVDQAVDSHHPAAQ